jgi:hypothetical protein
MPGGRPPKFKTPEEMQEAIDTYFLQCEEKKEPVTVSGMAFALGMTTETLRSYGLKNEFSATVKSAKQQVEIELEKALLSGRNATGPIFNLKNNFGWKDAREHTHSGEIVNRHVSDLSDSDLANIATSGSTGATSPERSKKESDKIH